MGCFSSKPTIDPSQPPPPTRASQQTQSKGEDIELRPHNQTSSPPVPPLRRPDATSVPDKQVHPDGSISAPNPPQLDRRPSQNPSPRVDRSKFPPVSKGISRTTSALHFDGSTRGGWQTSEGESSQKPLPESGSSNHSSSSRAMSRSASMDTRHDARYRPPRAPPSSFGNSGTLQDLDSRTGPRAGSKRAATTGHNTVTRSFLPATVREVLPDGFRYALRP
jgi:hypothetical protein